MKNIEIIFAGRLSYEKGFDLIIDFCHSIVGTKREEILHLHIYGSGILEEHIPSYSFVTYYGQQPKQQVLKKRRSCSYSLMPSRFLETFGLSALDSLSVGVPVIGNKRGGLLQFGEGIIDGGDGHTYLQCLLTVLEQHTKEGHDSLSKKCKDIARQYNRSAWKERFEEIVGKKIVGLHISLLSDYGGAIGGIESYISLVTQYLKKWKASSYSTLFGVDGKHTMLRYLFLPISIYNLLFISHIQPLFQQQSFDVIRWHSIQRVIGRLPLRWIGKHSSGKKLRMVHDFGLFHPFPSQVHSEEQLLSSMNIRERMKAGFEVFGSSIGKKVFRFLPLICKYASSKILLKTLSTHIDIILVPSSYMKKHIVCILPTSRIEVLPHAIDYASESQKTGSLSKK